ncbi:hypothetical protein JCM11641_007209 [Rhodosporidiobolus odoratus]
MGLLPLSHHLSLIKDCYPPWSSSTAGTPIPPPLSNPLSKLIFYSLSRPQKSPKLLNALLNRLPPPSSSSSSTTSINGTKRQEVGVTLEILKEVVDQWGASAREDASGFIRGVVAGEGLKGAEIGLRRGAGGPSGGSQDGDVELAQRSAALFASVATYLCPPFFAEASSLQSVGNGDGMGRVYFRCLKLVGEMAGSRNPALRRIALVTMSATAKAEFLVAAPSMRDYELQVDEILPILLRNLVDEAGDLHELRQELPRLHSTASTQLSPLLSARKPPSFHSTSTSKNSITAQSSANLALLSLAPLTSLFALCPSPLATSYLFSHLSQFLDTYSNGVLWHAQSQEFVLFLLRDVVRGAGGGGGGGERVGEWVLRTLELELEDEKEGSGRGRGHEMVTLLYVLKHLFDETDRAQQGSLIGESEGARVEAMGGRRLVNPQAALRVLLNLLGSIPSQAPSSIADDHDAQNDPSIAGLLLKPAYAALTALADSCTVSSSSIGIDSDVLSALVQQTTLHLRSLLVQQTSSSPLQVSGNGQGDVAANRVIKALGILVAAGDSGGATPNVVEQNGLPGTGHEDLSGERVVGNGNGKGYADGDQEAGGRNRLRKGSESDTPPLLSASPPFAPPVAFIPTANGHSSHQASDSNGTIRLPGLVLGAPVNLVNGDDTLRAPVSSNGSASSSRPPIPSAILTPASPSTPQASSSFPSFPPSAVPPITPPTTTTTTTANTTTAGSHFPTPPDYTRSPARTRNHHQLRINPTAFAGSLFTLSYPSSPTLRQAYGKVLRRFVAGQVCSGTVIEVEMQGGGEERSREGDWWKALFEQVRRLAGGEFARAVDESEVRKGAEIEGDDDEETRASAPMGTGTEGLLLPTAQDYSLLLSLLSALFPPTSSALAGIPPSPSLSLLLEALPAFLSLQSSLAEKWEQTERKNGKGDLVRAHACKELGVTGVLGMARVWGVGEVEVMAREALDRMRPLVTPSSPPPTSFSSSSSIPVPLQEPHSGFAARPTLSSSSPPLDADRVIESFSANEWVRRAGKEIGIVGEALREALTGSALSANEPSVSLSGLSLSSSLNRPTRASHSYVNLSLSASASPSSPPPPFPNLNPRTRRISSASHSSPLGSDRFSGLNSLNGNGSPASGSVSRHVSLSPSYVSHRTTQTTSSSLRAPSLADLQASLCSFSSHPGTRTGTASGGRSIASSVETGATGATRRRRRTEKLGREVVLENIGKAKGSGGGRRRSGTGASAISSTEGTGAE